MHQKYLAKIFGRKDCDGCVERKFSILSHTAHAVPHVKICLFNQKQTVANVLYKLLQGLLSVRLSCFVRDQQLHLQYKTTYS